MSQTAIDCIDERLGSQLALYEFGLLPPAERDQFENHLAECRPCADEVAGMKPTWDLLRAHADIFAHPERYVPKRSFFSNLSAFPLKSMIATAAAAMLFLAISAGHWNSAEAWRVASRMEINESMAGHRGSDGVAAGLQALQAGRLEQAEASLQAAAQEDARDYRAQYYLGACRLAAAQTGALWWKRVDGARLRAAVAAFDQAAALSETSDPVYAAQARLSLAQAYARLGDKARAREELQKVAQSPADDPGMAKIRQSANALRAKLH